MPTPGKSPVIPSMRYEDAPAAIGWLCNVLGFSKQLVVPLQHPEYGGAFFACRDPEGHVWNIGSYDPWEESS